MAALRRRRGGAIVVDVDRVLMIGQDEPEAGHRWYHFPGGGIEDGEEAHQTAERELFEETGLTGRAGTELIRVFTGAYEHRYFLMQCDDFTIGDCTGPELDDLVHGVGFAPEWIRLADLPHLPVWPRAVAEQLTAYLAGAPLTSPAPTVEENRMSWEGTRWSGPVTRHRACVVLIVDGEFAVIERARPGVARYATLPGGGVEPGETVEEAASREAKEELGVDVDVGHRLAVVQFQRKLQTYLWCTLTGGEFGTGGGEEFSPERQKARGTYVPRLVGLDELPSIGLRPEWFATKLEKWIAEPAPDEPERFFDE